MNFLFLILWICPGLYHCGDVLASFNKKNTKIIFKGEVGSELKRWTLVDIKSELAKLLNAINSSKYNVLLGKRFQCNAYTLIIEYIL